MWTFCGPADFFLRGYFQGKRNAEAVLASSFPEGGVAVRPSFIHGTRQVGSIGIPLGAVGERLTFVLLRHSGCLHCCCMTCRWTPSKKIVHVLPLMGCAMGSTCMMNSMCKLR